MAQSCCATHSGSYTVAVLHFDHFIDGRHAPPGGGRRLTLIEPATGRPWAELAQGDSGDVDAAVAAAAAAFKSWSGTPAHERADWLRRIADGIELRLAAFARAESVDTGKPLSLASTVDIPRAIQNFRFFAGAIEQFSSEAHVTDHDALNYTLRRPRGVAGLIAPWNLPLYLLTWKIAPALACGNTVVCKPSEWTPVSAALLSDVCRTIGLPDGVLNIVHGLGAEAGRALVAHPDVGTISFTGGTRTGEEIATACAPRFKKVALELGGKNPNVVFADCDVDEAVSVGLRAAFSNQGQICLCGSRILVERSIYERYVERFVAAARALRVGDPLDPHTEQGALVSAPHLDKVRACVARAREEGGELLCGGDAPTDLPERCTHGYFHRPTVIAGLDQQCRTNQEEIFGPVVTVAPFDDEDEAIAGANATRYGLAATLWTGDVMRAHRVSERLQAGIVWVNCWMLRDLRVPFGGMKQSGVGREGGLDALRFFTEPKNVCLRTQMGSME